MKADLILQALELEIQRTGQAKLDMERLKIILSQINSLERALTDVLRLAYERRLAA